MSNFSNLTINRQNVENAIGLLRTYALSIKITNKIMALKRLICAREIQNLISF